jgi:polysaccharide export outer membrane protein
MLAMVSGCVTTQHDQLVDFVHSHESEVSTGHYTVHPPDTIAIHSPNVPEVDGTTQAVRTDGKVVLRLLGEVDVVGLTTGEIAEKLEAQLSRYYVDPEVVVEVARYNSQFYYVFGEVKSPGPKRYSGRDTLLKALADAEPTFLAWRSQIQVIRPTRDGRDSKTIVLNIDDMVKRGDLTNNFLLQEGDIIQVPPTPLAWVGHRIRELLYPLDPVVRAYTLPASAINATRTYEREFGSDDNDNNSPVYWP